MLVFLPIWLFCFLLWLLGVVDWKEGKLEPWMRNHVGLNRGGGRQMGVGIFRKNTTDCPLWSCSMSRIFISAFQYLRGKELFAL
jgi:hypothetical protein